MSEARTQTRDLCTMAEFVAWNDMIRRDEEFTEADVRLFSTRIPSASYPPCLGCGNWVTPEVNGVAFIIDTCLRTLTFQPCGCVVTVIDMPDGWRP